MGCFVRFTFLMSFRRAVCRLSGIKIGLSCLFLGKKKKNHLMSLLKKIIIIIVRKKKKKQITEIMAGIWCSLVNSQSGWSVHRYLKFLCIISAVKSSTIVSIYIYIYFPPSIHFSQNLSREAWCQLWGFCYLFIYLFKHWASCSSEQFV